MTQSREQGDGDGLADLREHTQRLAGELPGSLRRLSVRNGETVVEVEWQEEASAPEYSPAPELVRTNGHPISVAEPVADPVEEAGESTVVSSPMVGTVYLASSPDKPPYVQVGDAVEQGQTVAIVEAMKLFNPIVSESAGLVEEVLVDDGKPVEFDQPLVRLRASVHTETATE